MEKLEDMVKFITANNTNPQFADWDTRVQGMLKDYAAKRGAPLTQSGTATPAPAPAPAPPANPKETVTTETQGDATIITTHHLTNAP
jgi:hypothetical protein